MMRYVRYVDQDIPLTIPDQNVIFDGGPRDIPQAVDYRQCIIHAITAPIGVPPLHEIVRPGQQVVLIVDDNTRLTPVAQILPVLLQALNRIGIPDQHIRAVIASGTHRAMTAEEKRIKYGDSLLSRIQFLDHNYKDPSDLIDYGSTARGVRLLVNKEVVQADFRIAIGNIVPHYPIGWSGGAKAVLPGVAGEETVAQMHFLGCRAPALGKVDTPMRQEMEDVAARIGLNFILNVILNRQAQIVDAVAGHFIHAHRVGVQISAKVNGLQIPAKADMVISTTSPIDHDLFQADKGINSAEQATKPGGEIILVSGCLEGISPAHPELAKYLGPMTNEQIWDLVHRQAVQDPLTAAEAIMLNDTKDKMRITLATTGLSPEVCKGLGFGHVWPDRLAQYLVGRLADDSDATIGILHQSAEVLPILTS